MTKKNDSNPKINDYMARLHDNIYIIFILYIYIYI